MKREVACKFQLKTNETKCKVLRKVPLHINDAGLFVIKDKGQRTKDKGQKTKVIGAKTLDLRL